MKILVIQLARFGDIYQTVPVVRALARTHARSEITVLVREKFKDATHAFDSSVRIETLKTSHILSPLIFQAHGEQESIDKLAAAVDGLGKFDLIINLSFSPFSSYLTDELADSGTRVRGYTRTHDGFLALPDDVSAYFYAQAGVSRFNRIHVTDLFAMVAGVELKAEDFCANSSENRNGVVIQVGASQAQKTLSPTEWQSVIEAVRSTTREPITLVGSKEDAGTPLFLSQLADVHDLRGRTQLSETFELIRRSSFLIAPDSVTHHIAALTATPSFSIGVGEVRFWETGPRVLGSRVFQLGSERDISTLCTEIQSALRTDPAGPKVFQVKASEGVLYSGSESSDDFSWNLISALYMDGDFPPPTHHKTVLALRRIIELSELGLEQLTHIENPRAQSVALGILNEIDFLMNQVTRIDESIQPLVNWFITQKIRITSTEFALVLDETKKVYQDLQTVLKVYDHRIQWSLDAAKDVSWKS